jgi:hypothetical protein
METVATTEPTTETANLTTPARAEILARAYYEIRQITDRESPFYIASHATIFRALRRGDLIASKAGRRTLLLGENIHRWLSGEQEAA